MALPQKDMWLQFGAVPFAPIMKQFASLLGIEYVKDKECRELHQVYGEFVEVKREFVVDFFAADLL